MNFEEAFSLCNYDQKIKDDFLLFFKTNFDFINPKINLFLFPQKDYINIFLLQTIIKSKFNNKDYDISILIYFPQNFPKIQPKIFLEKIGKVKINPVCEFYINVNNLEINYDLIIDNIENKNINFLIYVLNEIENQFYIAFPIFKNSENEKNKITGNECVIDKNICINIDINNCDNINLSTIGKINENDDNNNIITNETNFRNAIPFDIKNVNQFIDINKINLNDNNINNNNIQNNINNNLIKNDNNNNNIKNNINNNLIKNNNKNNLIKKKSNDNIQNINNINNNNIKNNNNLIKNDNNNNNIKNNNNNLIKNNNNNNIQNNNINFQNYYYKNIIPQYNENQIKLQLKNLIKSKVFKNINNIKKNNLNIKNQFEKIKYNLISDKNTLEIILERANFIENTVKNLNFEISNINYVPTPKININFNNLESFLIINNKKNYINYAKINSSNELIIIIKKCFEKKIIDFKTAYDFIRQQSRINFFLEFGKFLINK